ncbi:hypothetical protein CUBB_gp238c [Staphylococcus phage CUB-B]|nr:hypothetical protein CUBB_gp238c [Staphylococcus phage CUB-B]
MKKVIDIKSELLYNGGGRLFFFIKKDGLPPKPLLWSWAP